MNVQMDNDLIGLDTRLTDYGFTPEFARLINRLADKGILENIDIWYITGEYWNLV
jgi:hypothetical protein